jgi:hypothetical protein
MFLSCWLTSVRNLFSSRRLRGVRRPVRRWRQSDAQQQLEQLEARQVMAFDFVSAAAYLGAFITEGSTQQEAPPQITLTFSPGTKVDPQSIGSGISVIRRPRQHHRRRSPQSKLGRHPLCRHASRRRLSDPDHGRWGGGTEDGVAGVGPALGAVP